MALPTNVTDTSKDIVVDETKAPIDISPDTIPAYTYNQTVVGKETTTGATNPQGTNSTPPTPAPIVQLASDYKSANFVPNLSGWRLGSNGVLEAIGVILSGNISALTGNIGGWVIGSTSLTDAAGAVGMSSAVTGADDIRFWAGSATPASAPFSVTEAGVLKAQSGTIGGFTLGATQMYGGIIKTAATVGVGSTGVIMDTDGLRGYDSILGKVFDIPTDGTPPSFSSGTINETIFEISTNAILRTSSTVGDGTANSAGILINNTGLYGCAANQNLADANIKINIDGTAVFNASVRGGQTDYATGTGFFLGLSGGDYKFSIGDTDNYMNWDGNYLKIKGSFDVVNNGTINNSSYTVATLPVAPTSVGFNNPSANQASALPVVIIDSLDESNYSTYGGMGNGGITRIGQSFTNTFETTLDSAKFYFWKVNNPTGNAYVEIYAHTGTYGTNSRPTGVVLATSDAFDVSGSPTYPGGPTSFTFSGANRITLNAATYYVAILHYNGSAGGINKFRVALNTTNAHLGNFMQSLEVIDWESYKHDTWDTIFYVNGLPGQFTDPANIYASDNSYTTLAATSGVLSVEVSKDAGANWLSSKTVTFTGSDSVQTVGDGSTELWGTSFTRADMVDANFWIRLSHGSYYQIYKTYGFSTGTNLLTGVEIAIEGKYASSTISLDHLKVKIYYGTSILPIQAGSQVFASNGRKAGEGAGAGTGVLVFNDGSNWIACDTGATVAA
jgi:hypothetical protein